MSEIELLDRIRVVLTRPSHPGNIGAAARAMKTMGVRRLYAVRPRRPIDDQARAMSANALDVLEQATHCATLEEALAGTVLQVAFSARPRDLSLPALDVHAAGIEAGEHAKSGEVALVFGNELAGLANDEVLRCNRLAYIPTDPESSSLNLAAAVQVAVYEVRLAVTAGGGRTPEREYELAPHQDVEHFYAHLEQSLLQSGFLHPAFPRRLMQRLRRLFGRIRLERDEVNLLRGMLTQWDQPSRPTQSTEKQKD